MTAVSNSSNTSIITFAPETTLFKQFTLSSHTTKSSQIVTLAIDDQKETEYRRLTSDSSKPETVSLSPKAKKLVFTFSYEAADGKPKASTKVRSGGPYALGDLQSIMLAVENGDDVDYNDILVQLPFK